MDHDKIEAVLNDIAACFPRDDEMLLTTVQALEDAADLIRDLRTEIGNQETRIVDLEEARSEPIGYALAFNGMIDPTEAFGTRELAETRASYFRRSKPTAEPIYAAPPAADNAALIAAVPELLHVLTMARAHVDACDYDPEAVELVGRIDAALASIGRKQG